MRHINSERTSIRMFRQDSTGHAHITSDYSRETGRVLPSKLYSLIHILPRVCMSAHKQRQKAFLSIFFIQSSRNKINLTKTLPRSKQNKLLNCTLRTYSPIPSTNPRMSWRLQQYRATNCPFNFKSTANNT